MCLIRRNICHDHVTIRKMFGAFEINLKPKKRIILEYNLIQNLELTYEIL